MFAQVTMFAPPGDRPGSCRGRGSDRWGVEAWAEDGRHHRVQVESSYRAILKPILLSIMKKVTAVCLIHERRSEIDEKERERKTKRWKMAVERSLGWDLEAMSTDD